MRRLTLLLLVLLSFGAGCGYVDDNPRAAEVVAQAYLDGYSEHDGSAVCRVLAPEVHAAFAPLGGCEKAVRPSLQLEQPRLTVGHAQKVPSPPVNPRFVVNVREQHGRLITVGRYGSIWRVIHGGDWPVPRP